MRRAGFLQRARYPSFGPMRGGPAPRRRASRRRPSFSLASATLAVLVAAIVLFAATVGVQMAYTDRIPAGVQVLDVDVSGRTRAEARGLLQAAASSALRKPITLHAQNHEWATTPRELGVRVDTDALLDQAYSVGRQGSGFRRAVEQWSALLHGQRLQDNGVSIDRDQEEAFLQTLAAEVDRPAVDAQVHVAKSSDGVGVVVVPEQVGARLLVPESADLLSRLLSGSTPPATVDLPTEAAAPTITTADWDQARTQAERALSAPLVLTADERRWTIERDDVAKLLVFRHSDGKPGRVSVDTQALDDLLTSIARDVEQPALDARFAWNGGNLSVIRESQEGRALDRDAVKSHVREHLFSDDRVVPLTLTATAPQVSSADGPNLGIRELIRQGKTTFAGSVPEKQQNIALAASRINGTVIPPGGLFSFNKEVGPTTLDAGFKTGWGIALSGNGARTIPSVAGGICQVATTLFHPVFHAGYAIEERHAHLYWIPSYGQPPLGMKGLDATVDEDYGLDFRFVNTTPDYLLIQGRVDGANLVFELYGSKPSWTVKIDGPVITNVVATDRVVVRQDEPTMPKGRTLQVEGAQDGFDVTVTRTVTQGDDVRTLPLKSHYVPSHNVVLYGTGSS